MARTGGGWSTRFVHLECSSCGRVFKPRPLNVCKCGKPLLARYDLLGMRREEFLNRRDLWRYAPLLPVVDEKNVVSLGEGGTPLIACSKLRRKLKVGGVYIKDDGVNPTGTFKARGMAVAVSKAKELGITKLAVPTTGSAGSAMAAYAQKAGSHAFVAFARGAPNIHVRMARAFGARVRLCRGYMNEAVTAVQDFCAKNGYFNIATIREPYRLEGKKTITMEVAEELGRLPDVMLFPVGGGTGIIGAWKALTEFKKLRWYGKSPRLYCIQAEGCAPIFRAWGDGRHSAEVWKNVRTKASGLAIPKPFADELILRAIKETDGGSVAISDEEMRAAAKELEKSEGISACMEGAATLAGARLLSELGVIGADDTVVLVNTGRRIPGR